MVGGSKSAAVILLLFLAMLSAALIDELNTDSNALSASTSSPDSLVNLASSTYSAPVTIPVPEGRLTADYVKEFPTYSAEFKAEPADYGIEFSAYDVPLRFKPSGLVVGEERIAPSLEPRFHNENSIEYRGVFGDGIDIQYELEDSRLKESIIVRSKDAVPSAALSSSTTAIEFVLTYPDYVVPSVDGVQEWNAEPITTSKDIIFIRRKEPHKLYAVNQFYSIKAPYLNDSSGRVVDLSYTLERSGDETVLRLNIPPVLDSLEYPVVIDPTIEWDESGGIRTNWENRMNCSSNTNSCTTITSSPNEISFHVDWNCDDGSPIDHPVRKGLFEFDITSLYDYYGSVHQAKLWSKGSCSSNSLMPAGKDVWLYHIDEFGSGVSCSDHADDQGVVWLRRMMNKTTCPGSTKDYSTITSYLQDSLDASDDYFALKLDITPELQSTEEPDNTYYFLMNTNDLELEYSFTCTDSGDCPTTEFCNQTGTDTCSLDLGYGGYCEGVVVDNDNYACPNNNCQKDDFDNNGHYCTESNKCIHDGSRYDPTYIHCSGDQTYSKTCLTNTSWSSQTNCTSGCNEGSGCVTTTTTITTTTTTSTTLTPNIIITPETLTHRRNV